MPAIAFSFLKKCVPGFASLGLTAGLLHFNGRVVLLFLCLCTCWFSLSAQPKFTNPIRFTAKEGRTNTFNHVSGFIEDQSGSILIADGQFGIGIADPQHPEKGIVERLTLEGDIPLMPHRLVEDTNGDLWFYNDRNLNRINLQTRKLDSYDGHDGLISKED